MTTTSRSEPTLEAVPETFTQTLYCPRCRTFVPMYEFATKMCLDCVQAAYEQPGYDEGMGPGGDAYNDCMFGESPDW